MIDWSLDAEPDKVERVLGPDEVALHLLGMPYPAEPEDPYHSVLVARGYEAGSYREGGLLKRGYRAQIRRRRRRRTTQPAES